GGSIDLVNNSQAWLTSPGGKLKASYKLVILRVLSIVQQFDFANQDDFYPEDHEAEFDRITMMLQQVKDSADRSLKVPESVNPNGFDTSLPDTVVDDGSAGKVLAINETYNG